MEPSRASVGKQSNNTKNADMRHRKIFFFIGSSITGEIRSGAYNGLKEPSDSGFIKIYGKYKKVCVARRKQNGYFNNGTRESILLF